MQLTAIPALTSWRHSGARDGFEVLFAPSGAKGHTLTGDTTAVEGGIGWNVGYTITADESWRTTRVHATNHTVEGSAHTRLERGNDGQWLVDGDHRPDLDGCVDVDFESSAVTNTLPIHRIDFAVGDTISVPAAFVRSHDLSVERLEQTYTRLDEAGRFAYTSISFNFACELTYDHFGLIVNYPSIAIRFS
ncbi:hypothetical protein DFR67_101228 [Williamsia limnetica]|uniref:Glycolipid-binding protein n=1 Tax=Williamsia limnetica TaxID=882452 RepID=A0A318RPM4_WILLI|nr:putative glycolipid-binding domain-containing protein [Williamsia limnetica]PYE20837.1 hypothetical protein DFR67_101228 [Williamsia limnetica]